MEEKQKGPRESFKPLQVGIDAANGSNTGFISAQFDNVYTITKPAYPSYEKADANMDGKISLEETIYDLQVASKNREIPIDKIYPLDIQRRACWI